MADILKSLPEEVVKQERLKGAEMSVYFRWTLIITLLITLSIQLFSGYQVESVHSISLISIYFMVNAGLWWAVRRKYDPDYLAFLAAIVDVCIVTYHLHYSSIQFDSIAVTAAATMFLYPILFVLYTFRLKRSLLIFLVIFSLIMFNINYLYTYFQQPEDFANYLSTSPQSHIFKSIYIFFTGFLCIYLQHSISEFLQKQITHANDEAALGAKVKIEE